MKNIFFLFSLAIFLVQCKDEPITPNSKYIYKQTFYTLEVPSNFPQPISAGTNALTTEKIALGRMLFYDPILSADSSLACAGCHDQKYAFSDDRKLSINLDGPTKRNSMPLFNLAFTNRFFWDGRKMSLEDAVQDALMGEQHYNYEILKARIAKDTNYQRMVYEAFGSEIKEEHPRMAIASFIRTMVSSKSPFDLGKREGNYEKYLGPSAKRGANIFSTETGDCFHCHGDIVSNNLFTDNDFHNNGLDTVADARDFKDYGHGKVTGAISDNGKFRTPSLRNIAYTAPFFHDGRALDIDAVMKHYNEEVLNSPTIDANMKKKDVKGVHLTAQETLDLQNFIITLTDTSFIKDTRFSNPFVK